MSIDTRKLVAEIEEEVRRKRATGELPADLERELDNAFARYAPVGALDLDFEQVLAKIEESTVIDTVAPTESSRPGIPYFKLVVRKATGWYVRFVAGQVSSLVQALTRALRLLGERVDALESSSPGAVPEGRAAREIGNLAPFADVVVAAFAGGAGTGAAGRVLHGEAGTGDLLAHLVAGGVDAYGVEPDDDAALEGAARSLDVRADEVRSHLKLLENGSLAGLVLSGCVDRLPMGGQLELLDLAVAKLVPGGRLVVIGTDPTAWATRRSPVQADLAPGRPLHGETWAMLMGTRGFTDVTVTEGPAEQQLQTVPTDVAGAEAINANLALLNRTLYPPSTFAVVATRAAS